MAEMVTFDVIVAEGTLARSSLGSVTGVLFTQLGSQAFPEVGWNDFPVVMLGWWLRDLQLGLGSKGTLVRCDFMDGPFSMEFTTLPKEECRVRLVNRNDQETWEEGVVARKTVLESVSRAAATIFRACRKRTWESDDLTNLEGLLRAAERGV
jgi:hypothetical protein